MNGFHIGLGWWECVGTGHKGGFAGNIAWQSDVINTKFHEVETIERNSK